MGYRPELDEDGKGSQPFLIVGQDRGGQRAEPERFSGLVLCRAWQWRTYRELVISVGMFICLCMPAVLVGCNRIHFRPSNVPQSAGVDGTFVDCSADIQSKANRCTVYKGGSGEILADGLFVLGNTDRGADNSELRFVAFGEQGIYLSDLRILHQQTATQRDPSHRIFRERLNQIASKGGANALDCGEWAATDATDTVTECALAGFAHEKAFFARYYEPEHAHFRYTGIARASDGTLFAAFYSSGRTVWVGGTGKDGQLLDGNHTLVVPCPKPSALAKTKTGLLTCFELVNAKPTRPVTD